MTETERITQLVTQKFHCMGGAIKSSWGNPIVAAMENKPPIFALGVDVAEVVEFVLSESAKPKKKDRARE